MAERIKTLSQKADSISKRSFRIAKERGIKLKDTLSKDRVLHFQQINEIGEALYIGNHSNAIAANQTRTNQLYMDGILGLNLTGKSDTMSGKLGMWDGGGAMVNHQELIGRVTTEDAGIASDSHATHVSGTLIAQGINSNAKGMSNGANVRVWDFNGDAKEINENSKSLLVSNHSYGYVAGWEFSDTKNKWVWYGYDKVSSTEDYKFGFYDDNTAALDQYAYNAPKFLMFKSAGNNRNSNGPTTAGELYYLHTPINGVDTSRVARSKNNSYDIISTTGNAKNILTVGSVDLMGFAPTKASDVTISAFSSWGPTDDGRIKPDIMGVGTNIYSTSNSSTTAYATSSGTSMSSPQVAGSAFLLQQLYNRLNNNNFMRAATLKGLLLHTAMDIGPLGPDYKSGWGLLNAENAAKVIMNKDNSYKIIEGTLANGQSGSIPLIASGKGDLTATISWTDPEGKVGSAILNDRTPRLVNDLDIRIKDNAGTYLPFILDPAAPANLAKPGDNIRDNIEKIIIVGAIPGKSYELSYSHKKTLKDNAPQDYTIILSGIGGQKYCSLSNTNPSNAVQSISLNKNIFTSSSISDFMDKPFITELGQTIPVEITFSDAQAKHSKLYVDWNQDGDFDDLNELCLNTGNITTSTFSSTFQIQSTSSINQYYRIRLVTEFGSNNSLAKSCGSISAGEVEEYLMQITEPSNDVGALSFSQSTPKICATNGSMTFIAKVKNHGTADQNEVKVLLKITQKGQTISTLTGTIPTVYSKTEEEIALTGSMVLNAGETYQFELSTNLTNDQNGLNNNYLKEITVDNPNPPVVSGEYCTGASTLTLRSTDPNALWYNNNMLVGSGQTVSLPANKPYFAASGDFSASYGPKTKKEFGLGSYYANFGPIPIVDVKSPIVLESARVYVGTSGTIVFSVYDFNTGMLVGSVVRELTATRIQKNIPTDPSIQIPDDKNDPGQIVQLNLSFPAAGSYAITQECYNGASIYRSNRSLKDTANAVTNIGYPYEISNVIKMDGVLYNNEIIQSGYYYFYDMKLRSYNCATKRVEVPVKVNTSPIIKITPSGKKTICTSDQPSLAIVANSGDNPSYQWQLNGADIKGATNSTYTTSLSGKYSVKGSVSGGACPAISDTLDLKFSTPIPPFISYSQGILSTSAGTNIQWLLGGSAIPNANSNKYIPVTSGTYKVQLKDTNGCLATSDIINVNILATENENPFKQIVAFPNPVSQSIKIGLPDGLTANMYDVEVMDIEGKLVLTKQCVVDSIEKTMSLDVSKLSEGTYILRIPATQTQAVKIIKF
ncbi:S8 family serine peptidase [Aquirufa sp. ROCK2-A2]